jgi:hypothetical protein
MSVRKLHNARWIGCVPFAFLRLCQFPNEVHEIVLAKVQASVCNLPHPDRSAVPIVLTATVYAFTTVLVVLRLISKIWVSRTMGVDDWIVIIAQVCLMLACYSGANVARLSCSHPPTLQSRVCYYVLLLPVTDLPSVQGRLWETYLGSSRW